MSEAAPTQPCKPALVTGHAPPRRPSGRSARVGPGPAAPAPHSAPPSPQSFNAYFSHEHSRLLLVWRQVVGARRLVSEVKTATER